MIRKNPPIQNAQKQVYYTNRFEIIPQVARHSISGNACEQDIKNLSLKIPLQQSYVENDLPTIWVSSKNLYGCIEELKLLGFDMLTELSAIDFLQERGEFELFYLLINIIDSINSESKRIKVKTTIKPNEQIDSLTPLFKSANWAERECYDMFGIRFNNHPHLQRLLMPKDWVGHPLLKSYPLQGDEAAKWYEVDKIFGKEYREIIGPEQRDSARVDELDCSFAPIKEPICYQEENAPLLLKSFKTHRALKERR